MFFPHNQFPGFLGHRVADHNLDLANTIKNRRRYTVFKDTGYAVGFKQSLDNIGFRLARGTIDFNHISPLLKHGPDGLPGVNALDGFTQKRGNG
jgi:hypothetical protein